MQSRTAAPAMSTIPQPPLAPSIPISAVQSLIPRLTTTINDIDSLKAQIATGTADASLPSWDALLQRYSLLLGRINAISTFLSPQASNPTSTPGASLNTSRTSTPLQRGVAGPSRTGGIEAVPELARYLVHPLNALPQSSSTEAGAGGGGGVTEEISPLAAETFFQVINTLPHALARDAKLNSHGDDGGAGAGAGTSHAPEELRGMDDSSLEILQRALRDRLSRESVKARVILEEIERKEDEVDWGMRINEDADEDGDGDEDEDVNVDEGAEGNGGGAEAQQEAREGSESKTNDEEEDDLFGGEDDEGDVVMLDPPPPPPASTAAVPAVPTATQVSEAIPTCNPRDKWALADYVRYMDYGQEPEISTS